VPVGTGGFGACLPLCVVCKLSGLVLILVQYCICSLFVVWKLFGFDDNSKYYGLIIYPFGETANLYIAVGNVHSVVNMLSKNLSNKLRDVFMPFASHCDE